MNAPALKILASRKLLPLLLLLALPAVAQNNFTYTNNNDGTITLTGYSGYASNLGIPSMYAGATVTGIAEGAFDNPPGLNDLTSVTIPATVTNIQVPAFLGLTNITVDPSNPVYSSLNGVLFDKAQTTLLEFPLLSKSYTIPASVTSIGDYAFYEPYYGITDFSVIIPSSVTSIGFAAFQNCGTMTSITIPASVTNIGDLAFYECYWLSNVTIVSGVTSIGNQMFGNCDSLTSVTIPSSVTNIGVGAFEDCTSLTNVTIGTGVTNIGSYAFYECPKLRAVNFQGNSPTPTDDLTVFSGDTNGFAYVLPGTTGWGPYFDGLPTGVNLNVTITPLRVLASQANINPTNGIDDPIVPVTDPNVLAGATSALGLGVVADGVTPVLFNITGAPGVYSVTITNNSANANPSFYTNLIILRNGVWANSTNITIVASPQAYTGTVFACLRGLDWGQFVAPPPYAPVMITMTVASTNAALTNTFTFEVRPPPIVLVHGYNADANSWTPSFLTNLYNFRPPDFILPLQYGVSYTTNISTAIIGGMPIYVTNIVENLTSNTTGDLPDLALLVDADLTQMLVNCQSNWACTRYDVVGHSQGGVLTRMLCQTNLNGTPRFASTPVVSEQNFYRGRFRRVITIGSPHNGSLILHYALYMIAINPTVQKLVPDSLLILFQKKFDPFAPTSQISLINNISWPVDSRIKFNCFSTTIASGQPPQYSVISSEDPDCYSVLGLDFTGRGEILLPQGSDGVVDLASQGGGSGTPGTNISNSGLIPVNIAHSDNTYVDGLFEVFGVPPGQSDTTFPLVASEVIALLNGPTNAFGSFQLPAILSPALQSQVENIVPTNVGIGNMIYSVSTALDASTNYNFSLTPPTNEPAGGTITWYAQVFGTNGVSSVDVAVQVNATNSSMVTVTVTNGVQGTVVLYATYSSTNGDLVFANPVVVVSNPVGTTLNSISLQPANATLSPGDSISLNVWGAYTNGASSLLYLTNGQVTYQSSNPTVAGVDTNGIVTLNTFGAATISASYNGFTAQAIISSVTPTVSHFTGGYATNGGFQMSFISTLGTTNIIEASTNLISWVPIATLYNTNGYLQFVDTNAASFSKRFYRVEIPNTGAAQIPPSVSLSSPSQGTNGVFSFVLTGTPGMTNIIQTSTNLTTWVSLATLLNTNGTIYFTDQSSSNSNQRFYRALIP